MYGDVNGDGIVSSVDVTALYNYLLNNDSSALVNGDQDGDGTITAGDIVIIYNILLGTNSKAPEAEPESATNTTVKVGPVPSSDYIVASAAGYIQGVELYDMSGNLMARNGGNYMNVEGMRDGHYILKVYTATEVSSHHVAVIH